MNWTVYIILCSDDSLYTGISTDVEKRFNQHLMKKGAKYFYSKKPLRILFTEPGHTRATATRRELEIKKLSQKKKQELINLSTLVKERV